MAFRYIGSKARVAHAILEHLGTPSGGRFVDLFCGTGAVAEVAARAGWPVLLNDHLHAATVVAGARLTGAEQVRFPGFGGYQAAVATLNATKPRKGFMWREYSPASSRRIGIERRYFTESNAMKLDGMRALIAAWHEAGKLSDAEHRLLLADLVGAANRAANTAGTYGCFLSRWQAQALQEVRLEARLLPERMPTFTTSTRNARDVECRPSDVAYLDPPYTKRQYAAYYHILETLVLADEPQVEGVGGIRPWREKASDFCYRRKAVRALRDLVAGLPTRTVLLSYSDQGHVPLSDLKAALAPLGEVTLEPLMTIGRYRPNAVASQAGSEVSEVLIRVDRSVPTLKAAA
ncbi:DNA adenine methylase [Methylobacterium sp. D54C]